MILSMTGYGNGSAQKDNASISVEIKTVNHRFLDLHVRLSREFVFLEGEIQQMVRAALDRGRVDISAAIQNAGVTTIRVNSSLAKSYMEAADALREELSIRDTLDLKTLFNLPGVLQNEDAVPAHPEILTELVRKSMQEALDGVTRMRSREGEALRAEMLQHLSHMEENALRVREVSAGSATEYLEELRSRLAQLLPQGGIDQQRLAQEAALIADKCDITEEIARLQSHIAQYRSLMDGAEKAGKKLDFLLQEMQREANTILSKSGNIEITGCAISMGAGKSALVANVLQSVPRLAFSVSYTTRAPRGTEQNGVEYFFVGRDEFQSLIQSGELLEWAEVHGNYYGTASGFVDDLLKQGEDVILDIDVQGARIIRQKRADAIGIFVMPPSYQVLRERLKRRSLDDTCVIEQRLKIARKEIGRYTEYDYLIINEELGIATRALESIITGARCRMHANIDAALSIIATFGGIDAEDP
jgi:guanylate kinase